ncbi:MAG TPA: xylulokinase [Firmicutes bacterium]|nr:xylulokinase [Bacillota bacterium]
MAYLMGLDIGTTGVKTLICDPSGKTIGKAFEEYPLYSPKPGWAEQNPQDWWEATVRSIQRALTSSGVSGQDVKGIGLSGQMHSSVFLDEDNNILHPALLWCDVRTAEECRWISDTIGRDKLIEYTCNPALEGFTAPKIIWLRKNKPEIFARVKKVVLPKDYIRYKLTGELATEISDAAGTLLFDVARRNWSREVLEGLGLPLDIVPKWCESPDVCGHVTREVSEKTGLAAGTPVVGGGADNTCGAVGAGIVRAGRALSSIGSSGVIVAQVDEVKRDPRGRVHTFNHSVPHKWYLMGVMLSAGMSLKWFRDSLAQVEKEVERVSGIDAYDLLGRAAGRIPPGSEGLVFLPYLTGERTPHADANARGVFFGLSLRHGKAHMARAVMEGVVFGLRDSLEIIKGLGIEVKQLRAIGGGAKSPLWRQMQADIMNVEVVTINVDEGPAFGAALLAGVGVGIYRSVEEAAESTVSITSHTEPDAANARIYDEYYRLYTSLYPALKEAFRQDAALAR